MGGAVLIAGAARSAPAIDPGEITFVSWNVYVGNGDIRAFIADLRRGDHTPGRTVSHVVLLLQEAVRTTNVPPLPAGAEGARRIGRRENGSADIETLARSLGLSLIYVPSMRNGSSSDGPPEDRGSAILSSLPLTDAVAVELPGERQRRVAILASAGPVVVGTIHLDALGSRQRLWAFWTPWMRNVQSRTLRSVLPDAVLVLGADLNTWHGVAEPAVKTLREATDRTALSRRPRLRLRSLDYMFFRAGTDRTAQYHRVSQSYGSDHHPLVGWID